ncbi:unannotated protein [freshwater metagenome]|uniref:Unannotated protein n=1 Tax=freshwater metagenome TaxID=449393 RepID=A0A6J7QFL1_9ZZZZ
MNVARRHLPVSALVALTVALLGAGLSWACVFVTPGARVVASAFIGPIVVVGATRMRRKTPPLVITALLELLLALLLWLILAPSGERGLDKILTGVLHGWNTILSTAVPVYTGNGATAFAYVISALAGVISFEVLLRTRTRIWPSVPALCLATLAYFMGRGGPSSVLFPTLLLIVGAVSLALIRSRAAARPGVPFDESLPDDDEDAELTNSASRWGRKEAAVVTGIVALALGIVVMAVSAIPIFGGRNPSELHDSYNPRERTAASVNPLDQVAKSETETPSADKEDSLFFVELSEGFKNCSSSRVDRCPRFPIAYLPNFDGSNTWNADAILQPASERVDPPSALGSRSLIVKQTIKVNKSYTRGVLPGLQRLVRVSANAAELSREVDSATGLRTFLPSKITRKIDPALTYQAWSEVPVLTDSDLKSAHPDPSIEIESVEPDLQGLTELLGLRDKAGCQSGVNKNPGFQKLCKWEEVLASYKVAVENKSPGYSLGRLEAFLSSDPPAGTSDQFATTFATVAASLGYPVRVVVGYQVVTSEAAFYVTSYDLRAWPEVALAGLGWVAFSPFPGAEGVSPTTTTTTTTTPIGKPVTPTTASAPKVSDQQQCKLGESCGKAVGATEGGEQGAPIVLLLSLALVVLGIIASAPGLLAERRRRRAHTEGDPETRVSAAWNDALDRLREEGRIEVECLTAQAAETATATSFGLESAAEVAMLGVRTDRALHAPDSPLAHDADEAWRHADALRVLVDQTRTRWRRLRSRAIPARWR